ncbi:septum formation inhibitor MinC [Formicincola oecophyllae]|uniref:Probable septum site-determining protein MinC n=2 Tax=Formicincola oecophyllae TaxID=2558361 RepID=A0A4Y6UE60_9PROT|nr:septum formation inhibitor MinC [Formicincola oecophyllae]
MPPKPSLRVRARGRTYMSFILTPEAPLKLWLEALDKQFEASPKVFEGRPIVLDLSLLDAQSEGLDTLQTDLRQRGLNIIAIEKADPSWPALQNWDWPPFLKGGQARGPIALPDGEKPPAHGAGDQQATEAGPPPALRTMLIDRPVRSGQSVENPEGNIVILGAVSSGAEVMAGGSIHVYGALRGRAIAGIAGDSTAQIYTTRFEPELLAINGYYMVAEEIPDALHGQPARVTLDGERLNILPFANS